MIPPITKTVYVDINEIKKSCLLLNDNIKQLFKHDLQHYKINENTPYSTATANSYNLFLYPYAGFSELFHEIKNCFYENYSFKSPCYIQSWVNVYTSGENLDWHRHWSGVTNNSIHGFFCVNSLNSTTTYKSLINDNIYQVNCHDGLLVMSHSNDNLHKTSEWLEKEPRITIGFDIHPIENLQENLWINHWIPL
jgi:hypothetical protein